jgi:hypothetical protein
MMLFILFISKLRLLYCRSFIMERKWQKIIVKIDRLNNQFLNYLVQSILKRF